MWAELGRFCVAPIKPVLSSVAYRGQKLECIDKDSNRAHHYFIHINIWIMQNGETKIHWYPPTILFKTKPAKTSRFNLNWGLIHLGSLTGTKTVFACVQRRLCSTPPVCRVEANCTVSGHFQLVPSQFIFHIKMSLVLLTQQHRVLHSRSGWILSLWYAEQTTPTNREVKTKKRFMNVPLFLFIHRNCNVNLF